MTDFWSCVDTEHLVHDDRDAAIEDHLDGLLSPETRDVLAALPAEIEVMGYERMRPTPKDVGDFLDDVLTRLDEEYGDPDGDGTKSTPRMLEAERAFIAAVLDDYQSWACEQTHSETVNVADWVREHRPDWLEAGS